MVNLVSIAAVLVAFFLTGISATRRDNSSDPNRPLESVAATKQARPHTGKLTVLIEGWHSAIKDPFVAVCREPETYRALKKLDDKLPPLDEDFFKSHAIIVAYLGTRNTGGYSVEIKGEGDPSVEYPSPQRSYFRIFEKAPAKGAILPQIVTSPFLVASVEVEGTPPLILSLDYAFRKQQRLYRVRTANFSMSGGLAFTAEQFQPHGELLTLHTTGLVSFYISLAGVGAKKERFLSDFATALVQEDQFTIRKLTADFFVERPNSGLTATGTLKEKDGRLSLHFAPVASPFDGYQGEGSLEAELVQSPPTP